MALIMNLKRIVSFLFIFYVLPCFVNGEAQLVRLNEGDDIQLKHDGRFITPNPTCALGGAVPDAEVHSACYLHCILLGSGAGSCTEDNKICQCYGHGPPGYFSESYASKFNEQHPNNDLTETFRDPETLLRHEPKSEEYRMHKAREFDVALTTMNILEENYEQDVYHVKNDHFELTEENDEKKEHVEANADEQYVDFETTTEDSTTENQYV